MRAGVSLAILLMAALLSGCIAPASAPRPMPAPDQQQGPAFDPQQGPVQPDGSGPPARAESGAASSLITGTVKASLPPRREPPRIRDVAFATADRGWLLLDGQTLATTDGGATWRPAALPQPFESLSFSTPQLGHATVGQRLYRSRDGGESWAPVETTGWPSSGAFFVDEQHGWSAGSRPDALYRTQDGGTTWERLPDLCPEDSSRPFSFVSPTNGWLLCGFDGGAGAMSQRLYRTEDGGQTWQLLGEALVGKSGDPSDGKHWPGGLGIGDYVGDLFFLDEQHGWYTGPRYGSFMTTRDGGQSWQDVSAPELRGSQVGFVTAQMGYRFGLDTQQDSPWVLTVTRDGGKSWKQVYPRRDPLPRFYLDATTRVGEQDNALYRTDDDGLSWHLLSRLPAPLVSLFYTSPEQAWALLGMGQERRLYRSADGGATWSPVAAETDLGLFAHVQGIDGQTAILWDNANRLLLTRDGGGTFLAISAPLAEYGGHGFFFTSAEHGWFARDFRLHRTADGGASWQSVALPASWKAEGVTVGSDGRLWASVVDTANPNTPARFPPTTVV